MALRDRIGTYRPIVSSAEQNRYGYWAVTYSVAPALDLTVTVCTLGIDRDQAIGQAAIALFLTTGQEVSQ